MAVHQSLKDKAAASGFLAPKTKLCTKSPIQSAPSHEEFEGRLKFILLALFSYIAFLQTFHKQFDIMDKVPDYFTWRPENTSSPLTGPWVDLTGYLAWIHDLSLHSLSTWAKPVIFILPCRSGALVLLLVFQFQVIDLTSENSIYLVHALITGHWCPIMVDGGRPCAWTWTTNCSVTHFLSWTEGSQGETGPAWSE